MNKSDKQLSELNLMLDKKKELTNTINMVIENLKLAYYNSTNTPIVVSKTEVLKVNFNCLFGISNTLKSKIYNEVTKKEIKSDSIFFKENKFKFVYLSHKMRTLDKLKKLESKIIADFVIKFDSGILDLSSITNKDIQFKILNHSKEIKELQDSLNKLQEYFNLHFNIIRKNINENLAFDISYEELLTNSLNLYNNIYIEVKEAKDTVTLLNFLVYKNKIILLEQLISIIINYEKSNYLTSEQLLELEFLNENTYIGLLELNNLYTEYKKSKYLMNIETNSL